MEVSWGFGVLGLMKVVLRSTSFLALALSCWRQHIVWSIQDYKYVDSEQSLSVHTISLINKKRWSEVNITDTISVLNTFSLHANIYENKVIKRVKYYTQRQIKTAQWSNKSGKLLLYAFVVFYYNAGTWIRFSYPTEVLPKQNRTEILLHYVFNSVFEFIYTFMAFLTLAWHF